MDGREAGLDTGLVLGRVGLAIGWEGLGLFGFAIGCSGLGLFGLFGGRWGGL